MKRLLFVVSLLLTASYAPKLIAAPIPIDLSINASASFAVDSNPGIGDITHNSIMSIILGGVVSQTTVNDIAVSGSNPLAGQLTDINDGIAIDTNVAGGDAFAGGYFFDFNFALQNNSLTTAYLLSFVLSFDNLTSASGADAYAESKILLFDAGNTEFFFSDLTTDTLFGDQKNGLSAGTFGITQTDNGSFAFDILLAAGVTSNFRGELQLEGMAGWPGGFGIDSFANVSLSAARPLDTPPPQIPLPASSWLFALGLVLIAQRQLRKLP